MSFFHRLTKTKLMPKRPLTLLSEVKQAISEMMVALTEQIQMVKAALTVLSETTEFVTELRKATEGLTTEQKQRKRMGFL